MPEGDEATVARWVRQALSTVLHSPFEGPGGAADYGTLSNVLRYTEGWESVEVDQDEEQAAERALVSMSARRGVRSSHRKRLCTPELRLRRPLGVIRELGRALPVIPPSTGGGVLLRDPAARGRNR
ncbi:hypothetical protein [Streptomyces sp. KN37]|uniref:hypothetical protein n=1 Tax=Streptomyces sp. KN37 TaxID=3090667 RepID=UPI002A761EC1|nr:hypothetical protein [Streptomyces sp. KN37]WPO75141.1 hypothetical protein R9806_33315 [Streptomyces sp. KN37]